MRTLDFVVILTVTKLSGAIPLEDFYPYGAAQGDTDFPKNDDGSSPIVTISTKFPFFNNQHDSLYVNTNGAISFLGTLSQYTPDAFPLSNSLRIITPFWADVDIRKGGTVWYRETTKPSMLQRATDEVRLYYPSQTSFLATWIFIATWDDVAFFGSTGVATSKRNSFQAVLITNGRHSFTIFNYYEITWTTGTASGGTDEGLGGTPAQVGFNAGDGINYFAVNESRTDAIINLPRLSNVNVDGKFVFRIDTETIEQGGCNTGGTLTIAPRYTNMFGGERKVLSGPCIQPGEGLLVTATLGDTTIDCTIASRYSVTCMTPTFYVTGDVDVTLKVTTSEQNCDPPESCSHNALYYGRITIVNPLDTKPILQPANPSKWIRGEVVTLKWQTEEIPFVVEGSTLEIHVVKSNSDHLPRIHYHSTVVQFIDTLQTEVSFKLETDDDVIVLSLVEAANDTDQNQTQRVWSDAIVVIPRDETESKMSCRRWKAEDDKLPFLSEIQVQVCPCRFDQANIDVIRFHPDSLCQPQESSTRPDTNCLYHPRARQCFRLNRPGTIGTGRLCCYDNKGNLMDILTSSGGGYLQRFHYFGDGEAVVPYLSNVVFDTAPYYHCCVYPQLTRSDIPSECFEFYLRREPGNCNEFVPNTPAQNVGDPHFVTPDGLFYTFNGVGEFVLFRTKSKNFVTQVRMQPFASNGNQGSVITSFVVKAVNISDTVEIRLNSIRGFDILINRVVQDITGVTFLRYKGVTVSVHDTNATTDGHKKEVNLAFPGQDIGFQTLVFDSLLNYVVSFGPTVQRGSIEGLLGNLNNDPNDDLVSRAGDVLPSDSSTEHIHNNMGITWRVTEEESLFTYAVGTSYSSIQNTIYVPLFDVPETAITDTTRAICGNDTFCYYDYYVTQDEAVAKSTQVAGETLIRMQEISRPVVSCGFPPLVEFGQWNYSGMEVGDTATLRCNSDRAVHGGSEYITCNSDGRWSESQTTCILGDLATTTTPPPTTVHPDSDDNDSEASSLTTVIVAVTLALVLVIIIIVTIVLVRCVWWKEGRMKFLEGRNFPTLTKEFENPEFGSPE